MAQNLYARLAEIKADMNISGATQDAGLLRLIERMSRAADDYSNRRFYAEIATRYYNGNGCTSLWIPDDLLTVTTLKVDSDRNDTYDMTLAVNTDYWLYPDNLSPKTRIDLNPNGTQISVWPKVRRSVQLVGTFGYSNETELNSTLGAAITTTTATSITLSAGHSIDPGETIVIDSEQIYVTIVSSDTLIVVRGLNGTTAATHANAASVYRRRYPRPVEEAVTMQVARFLNEQKTGYSGQAGAVDIGGFSFSTLYPAIRDMLNPYRVPVVG